MKDQQGFSLIELMIVVAIVGILAAIALPYYLEYTARSQVAEGVATAGAIKISITEFRQSRSEWPAAGLFDDNNGGRYTASAVHDANGQITVTLRGASPVVTPIRNTSFYLTPNLDAGGNITDWVCTVNTLQQKYLPTGCQ